MEDIAAGQAERALQIQRRQRLIAQHAAPEVRRPRVDGVDHQIRDGLAVRVPAAVDFGMHVLAEQTGDVLPGRREPAVDKRVVERRRNHQLDDGLTRPAGVVFFRLGVEIRLLEIAQRRPDQNAGLMMRLQMRARRSGEVRQLAQRDIHAERGRTAAIARDPRLGIFVQRALRHEMLIQQFRIDVGHHHRRRNFATVCQHYAHRTPALDQHLRDFGIGVDANAARETFFRHRLGDRAHTADRMPPHPGLAVHFAEHVVQQHIGRTRRVRTGEIADHRIPAQRRFQRLALKPTVQQIARGFREQIQQIAARGHVQRLQLFRGRKRGQPIGQHEAVRHVRRRALHQLAQHHDHAIEHRVILRQLLHIALRPARDVGRAVLAAEPERLPIGQRQEIRIRPLHHPQPVFLQTEIADHFRIEQAHGVTRHRIAEPRMELLGDGRAADDMSPLQHTYRHTRRSEIRRTDQTVVAAAQNEDIGLGVDACGHVRSRGWVSLRSSPAPCKNKRPRIAAGSFADIGMPVVQLTTASARLHHGQVAGAEFTRNAPGAEIRPGTKPCTSQVTCSPGVITFDAMVLTGTRAAGMFGLVEPGDSLHFT